MKAQPVNSVLKSLRMTVASSLKMAAAALMLCAVSACDDKNEPETPGKPQLPEGHTYISMMVSTGGAASRADQWEGPTWGDFYTEESASKFERTIDPTKIHVALYDADGNTFANLDSDGANSDVVIRTLSEAEGLYQIFFDVSKLELEKGKEYVAAVIANYNGRPDAETIDNNTFNFQTLIGATGGASPIDYYKGRMPMFGFIRWKYGQYADPETIDAVPVIGKIELLRAVCKIEVMIGDPDIYPKCKYMTIDTGEAPHLAYVRGRHINTSGHVAPAKATWLDPYKQTTSNLSFNDSFFELTRNRWTSDTSEHLFLPAHSADAKMYYIYLPEASGLSLNPNFDALRLTLTVNYNNPEEGTPPRSISGTLFPSIAYDQEHQQYPAYTNYNRWKLTRNHIYRFIITDIANETGLKYNVSVAGEQVVNVPTFD